MWEETNSVLPDVTVIQGTKATELYIMVQYARWRMGGEVKGKTANGVGSQYPSHYLGT
jgi:hypothetical protein